MTKSKTASGLGEIIRMYIEMSKDHNLKPDQELLRENNMSPDQWYSFVDLIEDLDLNETGVKILLEEIQSGRVNLPGK